MLAFVLWLALSAEARPKPLPADPERAELLRGEAVTAYRGGEYEVCADKFAEARKYDPETDRDAYDAACCEALAGQTKEAFERLEAAANAGYAKADHLASDPDLASLHADPQWEALLARVKAAQDAWLATINAELYTLYTADQADRASDEIEWSVVRGRDDARRARVAEILAAGGAKVSVDWYHAAMVYQHGPDVEDARKAHELALTALSVEPVHEPARWLAAASEDRLLMREGKPQKWGTQFVRESDDGPWILYEVDPTVTDEERAKWNVPPLAEARRRAEAMNQP